MHTKNQLIYQIKAGERQAFQMLVDAYQQKVINTCYSFVKNQRDAEDIAQEVFIEIYRSIGSFKEESELSTWIYRISINKSLDFLRMLKRKKRIQNLIPIFNQQTSREINISDQSKNMQDQLEQDEMHQLLHQAINQLPSNQRIALTLNKFENLTSKEIASIMEISISSVESMLHRSKNNLREILLKNRWK